MKGIIRQTKASGAASSARLALFCASSLVALTVAFPAVAAPVVAKARAATDAASPDAPASATQDQATDTQSTGLTEAQQDEIVVTGIRGSLQRNLDAKRDASGARRWGSAARDVRRARETP